VRKLALVALAACSTAPVPHRRRPVPVPIPDAGIPDAAIPDAALPEAPLEWLKGDTHSHAAPSGDSHTDPDKVFAWYHEHGYDFMVLTDHNRVTNVDELTPPPGLIVIPGVELTYNPTECEAPARPEPDGKCRIHVNLLGVTGRPEGKIEWANRDSRLRLDSYQAAIDESAQIGGLVQINHPQWWWGMTADLLVDLAKRGVHLVEIANAQFAKWNAGDATHPSMEQLWDTALTAGVDLWGVASDDAHDYQADGGGKYPAGGGWIFVHARRDAASILDAIDTGQFYSSNGVVLSRADVEDGELVVEVDPADPGEHTITFVGDGQVLSATSARSAREPLGRGASYVRAVVTRDDGAKAWTQPAREHE
jgi:hypothetical protein